MNASQKIKYMFFGWLLTITLKYIVFGLNAWNGTLHPGLVPAPNQQPYLLPFLGLFVKINS
jgi:hypothetical protein